MSLLYVERAEYCIDFPGIQKDDEWELKLDLIIGKLTQLYIFFFTSTKDNHIIVSIMTQSYYLIQDIGQTYYYNHMFNKQLFFFLSDPRRNHAISNKTQSYYFNQKTIILLLFLPRHSYYYLNHHTMILLLLFHPRNNLFITSGTILLLLLKLTGAGNW